MKIALKSTAITAQVGNILDSDQVRYITNGVTIDADVVPAAASIKAANYNGSTAQTSTGAVTSGGTYTGTADAIFTVEITHACTAAGTITGAKFKWKKNGGAFGAEVAATGEAQDLSDGVTVALTVDASKDFVVGEQFEILAYAANPERRLKVGYPIGKITATGLYGPYDPTATDGRATPVYMLGPNDAVCLDGTTAVDVAVGAMDHARVIKSRLPLWPTPRVVAALKHIDMVD